MAVLLFLTGAVAGIGMYHLWYVPRAGGQLDHMARLLLVHQRQLIERMESCLRGVASCSTCEACRGAALRTLGDVPDR